LEALKYKCEAPITGCGGGASSGVQGQSLVRGREAEAETLLAFERSLKVTYFTHLKKFFNEKQKIR